MSTEQDPRLGFTSASNAAADRACTGRHLAQRGCPEDSENRDARTGTLIHKVFAGEEENTLEGQEKKTLERAKVIEDAIVANWYADHGHGSPNIQKAAKREIRQWAYIDDKPVHSGQADAFWFTPKMDHAILEDLKSLWGDVADADKNEQLRDLAAMLWWNYGVETVTAFINQPNVTWKIEDVVVVKYDKAALKRAHKEMIARVKASNKLDAPRVVGPQCNFCRAAGTARCPESQEAIIGAAQAFDFEKATPVERGDQINMLKSVEKIIEKTLKDAKESVANGLSGWATGWKVGEGKTLRSIESAATCLQILGEFFPVSAEDPDLVSQFTKVSVPDLLGLYTKLSKSPEATAKVEFQNLFGHLIQEKKSAGSLVKDKTPLPEPPF